MQQSHPAVQPAKGESKNAHSHRESEKYPKQQDLSTSARGL